MFSYETRLLRFLARRAVFADEGPSPTGGAFFTFRLRSERENLQEKRENPWKNPSATPDGEPIPLPLS